MSRNTTRLKIDGEILRSLIASKETFSERAAKQGVSKQAVHSWIVEGLIPPRALCELVIDLDVSIDDLNELLEPQRKHIAKRRKFVATIIIEESND